MSMPAINPLINRLSAPPIPAVQAWARDYDGSHGALIDLSQAVPGYPPHPDMLRFLGEAAGSVASAGYGPIEGEKVLRGAYAAHVGQLYRAQIDAANVHITSGCNQAFIDPFYFNHRSSLDMLGIASGSVPCHARNGFIPSVEDVRAALRPGITALALVSPNNPTGAIYPAGLLSEIYALCRDNGTWLILDETYRDFLADANEPPHRLFDEMDWPSHLIQLYSFSKSFCIPGHRLGAIVAGQAMVENVAKVMDNLQICASRAPQIAVARAIEPLTGWRDDNRGEIARRASALRSVMANIEGWYVEAVGAYFAFVRHPYPDVSSVEVAERLAKSLGIITLPGRFFGEGQEAFLRFAFANVDVSGIEALGARLPHF
jgi:aspartate/methionine/tyrosine aminotransferase